MKLLPFLIAGAFGRKKGSSRTENEGIAKLESTINALDNDGNDLFKDSRFKKDNFQKSVLIGWCLLVQFRRI